MRLLLLLLIIGFITCQIQLDGEGMLMGMVNQNIGQQAVLNTTSFSPNLSSQTSQSSQNSQASQASQMAQTSSGPGKDFVNWFNDIQSDAWGNSGFIRLINSLNSNLQDSSVLNWLSDIKSIADQYFPQFCNTGNEASDRQEFAAFLTSIAVKTAFDVNRGFPQSKESGCPNCLNCSYNSKGNQCMSSANREKQYYGRGPLQLKWDSQYKNFSNFYYNDNRLISNPDLVSNSTVTSWAAAIWQWMTPQKSGGWCFSTVQNRQIQMCENQCPSGPYNCKLQSCKSEKWLDIEFMSAHQAMHGGSGIGEVINIFTGTKNCCPSFKSFVGYDNPVNMVEIYYGILNLWNQPLTLEALSSLSIQKCPSLEKKKINCAQITTNNCFTDCCSIIA